MTTRRGFLKTLGVVVGGALVAPIVTAYWPSADSGTDDSRYVGERIFESDKWYHYTMIYNNGKRTHWIDGVKQ